MKRVAGRGHSGESVTVVIKLGVAAQLPFASRNTVLRSSKLANVTDENFGGHDHSHTYSGTPLDPQLGRD